MSQVLNLCDGDEGWVDIQIAGAMRRVDVFAANNYLYEINESTKATGSLNQFHDMVVKYLQDLGFPPVSHFVAVRFVEEINRVCEDLKKKASGGTGSPPMSPPSTESTPTAGPGAK
jgi:hypothetical protein